jgi:hypothetical protein
VFNPSSAGQIVAVGVAAIPIAIRAGARRAPAGATVIIVARAGVLIVAPGSAMVADCTSGGRTHHAMANHMIRQTTHGGTCQASCLSG